MVLFIIYKDLLDKGMIMQCKCCRNVNCSVPWKAAFYCFQDKVLFIGGDLGVRHIFLKVIKLMVAKNILINNHFQATTLHPSTGWDFSRACLSQNFQARALPSVWHHFLPCPDQPCLRLLPSYSILLDWFISLAGLLPRFLIINWMLPIY